MAHPDNLVSLSFALILSLALAGCPSEPPDDDDDSVSDDDDSVSDDDDSVSDDDDSASDDDDSASDDDDSVSDDDDSADALVWTTLNCTGVTLSDADGDGTWSPGEVLFIEADLINEGPVDHIFYPSFLLEVSGADVDLGLVPEWTFFVMMVNSPEQGQWSVTAPTDGPTPQEVEFTITGQNMNPEEPCGEPKGFEPPCVNSTPFVFSATIE